MLNSPPRPSSSCLDFNPQSLYIPPHPAQDSVFLSLFSSDPIFGATPCSYAPSYSAWALTPWAEVLPCMDALLTLLWATHHRVLPPRQRGLLALHPLWVLMLFSVAQLCWTLCNSMDCRTPGFPVHYLPEFVQTHVHWVDDASGHLILSLLSPSAFSLSQHQVLFPWVGSSHQVAEVLQLQFQHQSFQWIFRVDFL